MAKRFIVDLSEDEEAELVALSQKGWPGARKSKRRHRVVEGGLSFALNELPRAGRLPKINDKVENILTTLAQSQPPDGHAR